LQTPASLRSDIFTSRRNSPFTSPEYAHATQASYLSEKYAQLALSNYYRGAISVEQLADYLNVSVKNVPGIEYYILRKTS